MDRATICPPDFEAKLGAAIVDWLMSKFGPQITPLVIQDLMMHWYPPAAVSEPGSESLRQYVIAQIRNDKFAITAAINDNIETLFAETLDTLDD